MPKQPSRAFTLIELLVVVVIVSLLAAILLPVLASAKEAAKKSVCLAHTKQLGMGVLLYAGDADDHLPPTQNGGGVLWTELLDPYLRSEAVCICPSDSGSMNSYGLNERIFVDFTDLSLAESESPELGTIASPSSTVMTGETGVGDDFSTLRKNTFKLIAPGGCLNDLLDARPAPRHFDHCEISFFDGHAESRKLDQFYRSQTPRNRWFCLDSEDALNCDSE